MYDDGAHGDGVAGDGIYGATIPRPPKPTAVRSISLSRPRYSNSATTTVASAGTYTVAPSPTITTSSPLASGNTATAYTQTLAATGGTPGYTWSLFSGSLPPGLTLSSGGVISGTATAGAPSTSWPR